MKGPAEKETPKTLDLRDKLKSIVGSELDRLPTLLENLNNKDRLHVILRLMPIVMPKAKPVHHTANEPGSYF